MDWNGLGKDCDVKATLLAVILKSNIEILCPFYTLSVEIS
jgi:hypothetical protein